jgi:MerR family transcriptional regulator/heat shock protein HspR
MKAAKPRMADEKARTEADRLHKVLDDLIAPQADDEPMYVISVAADLVGVHAQTLRHYERAGLVDPARSEGNIRLFSPRDVRRMRAIALLTGDLGLNLAGVEVIMELRREVADLRRQVEALERDIRLLRGHLLEDSRAVTSSRRKRIVRRKRTD